ncbi:MAG: class I SAM-dependent methyltransferase, partial [Gammaproteobacteria bacterium]
MSESEQIPAPWPEAELDHLGACPLCHSSRRKLLHEGLSDKVFYCAPGVWTLWHCEDCEAAYLDPRPSPASIGMAYSNYFTHESVPRRARFENKPQTGLQGLVQRFRNGELNRCFGYRREPALRPRWLSSVLPQLISSEVARLDRHIRQLPPPQGPNSRLLDVGAGNGDFVALAQTLGYQAQGLEADANAVAVGRERGLALEQGSMPGAALEADAYEQITLNHVIEHLHDPHGALRELH